MLKVNLKKKLVRNNIKIQCILIIFYLFYFILFSPRFFKFSKGALDFAVMLNY